MTKEEDKECVCSLCGGEGIVAIIAHSDPDEPHLIEWDEKPCPDCQNDND